MLSWRSRVQAGSLSAALFLLTGACGGDDQGPSETASSGSPTLEPACPPSGAERFSGPTSEDLCVRFELNESGDISSFELEIMATCAFGSGEGIELGGAGETITSDAAFDAGETFQAVATVEAPVDVGADGTFASGNLTGTITDDEAQGSYEFSFSSSLNESLTCSGGPITWTATRSE